MIKECKVTKLSYTAYPKNGKKLVQAKLKFECGLLLSISNEECDRLRGMPFPVKGDICCPKHANNTMAKALQKIKKQTRGDIPEIECRPVCYNLQDEKQAKIYWKLVDKK
jgi:hypothetical protein